MKSPDDAHFLKWDDNPEPMSQSMDPNIILDTEAATADAYLWQSKNVNEGWLEFDGELMEVRK